MPLLPLASLLGLLSLSTALLSYQPYLPYRPVPLADIPSTPHTDASVLLDTTTYIYGQSASTCFLDNIRTQYPLSALYFNSSDFRLSTAFQNCMVQTNTQNYNPYVRVLSFSPRVSFSEVGSLLCARCELLAGKDNWIRIGFKASLPIKQRTITRNDVGSRGPATTQDLVSQAAIRIVDAPTSDIFDAAAYRLDFVEALPADAMFSESIQNDGNGNTVIMGTIVNSQGGSGATIGAAFVQKPENQIPHSDAVGVLNAPYGTTLTESDVTYDSQINAYLPATGQAETKEFYEMQAGVDYTPLLDSASKSVAQRIRDQNTKATLWLIGTYQEGFASTDFSDLSTALNAIIQQYNQNIFEFFYEQNYSIDTETTQGLGDLRLESYMTYAFSPNVQLTIKGGACAPTAGGAVSAASPYAIQLGNRGHTEFFVGGGLLLGVPKTAWYITTDFEYTTVLPATEQICATPQGAQIKNMGPAANATISWHSAQGSVWLHIPHSKAKNMSLSVGYEWYAKVTDSLAFAADPIESWLGNTFNTTTLLFDQANYLTLDPTIAKMHTAAVSHMLRFGTTYRVSKYAQVYMGAGFVILGRNTPRTSQFSIGCTIAY